MEKFVSPFFSLYFSRAIVMSMRKHFSETQERNLLGADFVT